MARTLQSRCDRYLDNPYLRALRLTVGRARLVVPGVQPDHLRHVSPELIPGRDQQPPNVADGVTANTRAPSGHQGLAHRGSRTARRAVDRQRQAGYSYAPTEDGLRPTREAAVVAPGSPGDIGGAQHEINRQQRVQRERARYDSAHPPVRFDNFRQYYAHLFGQLFWIAACILALWAVAKFAA